MPSLLWVWVQGAALHLLALKFIRIFLVEVNTHLNWTFDWQTALHHAARNGHLRCLKVLIDAGARVDIKNKDGKTAMQIAFEMGEIDCGNYLRTMEGILSSKKPYESGFPLWFLPLSKPNHKNFNRRSPLILSAIHFL